MIMMNITQICFVTLVSDIRYKYFNFSVSRQWICVLNRFCPHFNIIFNNLWLIDIILLLPLLIVFPIHLISLKRNIFYFKDLNNYIGSWMSINALAKSRIRINASNYHENFKAEKSSDSENCQARSCQGCHEKFRLNSKRNK